MFECKVALNASRSKAGRVQMPHFKTVVSALLASRPLYTFEIRDLLKPDSPVPAPITHQHQRAAIEAQALRACPPSSLGVQLTSASQLLSETPCRP